MKATGIVRRIDDLGRVVIPKEIRRTLRLREGDPMEIFTCDDGGVILRKYSAIGDLSDFAASYAESLSKTSGFTTCITDRDGVIAASGNSRKEYMEKKISHEFEQIMEDRSTVILKNKGDGYVPCFEESDDNKIQGYVITPILAHGDPVGAVVLLSFDSKSRLGDTEVKLSQSAADVLGKQLEQ